MEPFTNDRLQLPRNMIENSMFEEEPDVVDLAKEPCLHPLEPDEVEYEPRGSRLLVRGLGEHEMDEDEEDYESSAKLLGMSFMNRSSGLRNSATGYRQNPDGACSVPSARTMVVCAFVIVVAISVIMVIYLLPRCTFTKEGCHRKNQSMGLIQPIATNGKLFPWAQFRLPTAIMPLRYELNLHPNITSMTFKGSVVISIQPLQATWNIILHSSGHNISRVTFMSAVSSQEKQVEVLEYPLRDQIAIVAPEALLEGHNYTLKIEYSANISSSYYGFYGFSYRDENDEKKYFAATQFEPMAARSAFPCFDEPAFKATFVIRIIREEQYTALSNMPKKSSVPTEDGLVQDEFFESVKMSTYLVAFIVGEMKNLSQDVNGTLVSIYAVPEKIGQVQHALDTAVKLLEFFENYFEIEYPLKKLDLVAIPDFEAGAMENWGLLTFREETLLCDNCTSSVADRKVISKVIAHELSHQWFGNLVTMKWWNDLWLNEGFATFMEYFALEKIFKDLSSYEDFLDAQFKTMKKDSLNSSHPISSSVQSSEQIEEMFDSLSYFKGASLLLMLKTYFSEDIFQHAILLYLHNHSYGSIQNDDLWDSFNEITNKTLDVKKMMKTWTLQKGFPLVTVQRNGKELLVQQERFFLNIKPDVQPPDTSYLWHIPLSYFSGGRNYSNYQSVSLLDKKTGVINLTEEAQWIKLNVHMSGYYIVHYAGDGWDTLIKQLKINPTVLSDKDRASLINNIFELASLGKVPLQKAFDLIDYLRNENCSAPINEALFQTGLIYNLLEKLGHMDLASRLVTRIFKLLQNQIQQQTWTDEGTPSARELRSVLLEFACTHNLDNCSTVAKKLFDDWKASNGTQSLSTDVMTTVFKVGAKTESGWSFLLSKYISEGSESEKNKILEALASSEDVWKLYWLMKNSLSGDMIRTQKLSSIIRTVGQRLPGHLLAWDFVKENWNKLVQKFHLGSYTIQSIVAGSTHLFSTEAHLSEVRSFFENQSEATFRLHCVQEALEVIQLNIQWMEKNLQTMTKWL
ncbi:leucyl-cystinyl aminopeptidase [Erinaceus europaeus]|uniref:Leucyl-cystinyl aminopeptidase n=1 Tax=Erinaceus europaeus TaxID=9365 RepID=A0A1S3A633_ERIEU|nr:leucyl-cystinyl aminopeptidase [Erinaceus europaeus]XP_060057180.1 leucyl-cystinyl aminopeptidase [Erinaceus europaeus]XP_060057181.1 leucyl-cystinyl aminopeptidase [Erinaceus europaeus]XP_060057182.1 leucyl-cystinyl aminopeptidase [Erinaceus europaeus]